MEGDFFTVNSGSGITRYDPNSWVQVYVPGFGIDSSGSPYFDTEGVALPEAAKVLLNTVRADRAIDGSRCRVTRVGLSPGGGRVACPTP